jgi:uncharacterized protein YdcH (DUF465 family)
VQTGCANAPPSGKAMTQQRFGVYMMTICRILAAQARGIPDRPILFDEVRMHSGACSPPMPDFLSFSPERISMFPEYRDLISKLKTEDRHFERRFNEHNALDEKITEMEKRVTPVGADEIETLKKKKLALKDELYQILRKASAEQ